MTAPGDPLGPVPQDPDAVREAACRLTAPEQVCTTATSPPDRPASGGGGGGSAFVELLAWVLFVGLVVALAVVVVRVLVLHPPRRRRRRDPGAASDRDDGVADLGRVPSVAVDGSRTPDDWRREADAHRAAGRHRDALRCRYRALVGDLARRDLIDEVPGRTTGEERRQLAAVAPPAAAAFTAAADLFDAAWYGDVEVGAADVARMVELERDVLARAAGHAPALTAAVR